MIKQDLIREGKGKRVYNTSDPNSIIIEFMDFAKAFHGLKIGKIDEKAHSNMQITEKFYNLIEASGIRTHFIQTISDNEFLAKKVKIIPIVVKIRNRVAGSLGVRLGLPNGTVLKHPVIEFCLKNEGLDYPLVNRSHLYALELLNKQEIEFISNTSFKINDILSNYLKTKNIDLIDFKMEYGRFNGEILLADDITPDNSRFWDSQTDEPLDMDLFRWGMDGVESSYIDFINRIK